MRFVLFLFFLGSALAAPGSYNYQVHDDNDFTPEQYQLLQQYIQQQDQQSHNQVEYQAQQQKPEQQLTVQSQGETSAVVLTQHGYESAVPVTPHTQQLVLPQQQQQQRETGPVVEAQSQPQVQAHPHRQPQPQPQISLPVQPHPIPQIIPPQGILHELPHPHYHPPPTEPPVKSSIQYNKEFFYLSAPQDDFDTPKDIEDQLNQIKKNVRVVFIRAPEQNGIANAALQLAKQNAESQTAIYILTKQHSAADLANKLQQVRGAAHAKPEVVFIKYRTPAEAEHAQRTIQAQYEALDGPNHFNHDGNAVTHSFVGSTAGVVDPRVSNNHKEDNFVGSVDSTSAATVGAVPSTKYLPSAAKH